MKTVKHITEFFEENDLRFQVATTKFPNFTNIKMEVVDSTGMPVTRYVKSGCEPALFVSHVTTLDVYAASTVQEAVAWFISQIFYYNKWDSEDDLPCIHSNFGTFQIPPMDLNLFSHIDVTSLME